MIAKNRKAAEETLNLHLVNAIARALAADAHVDYLRVPARVTFKTAQGAQPGKEQRTAEPEGAADILPLLAPRQQVDPNRLAPDPRRVLPYLVTVNPLTVTTQSGEVLTVPEALLPLEPSGAPDAWAALRMSPRNPVHVKEGRWRWKDGVTHERRADWLALAALAHGSLELAAATLQAERQRRREAPVRLEAWHVEREQRRQERWTWGGG